jgi:hypothetical protein
MVWSADWHTKFSRNLACGFGVSGMREWLLWANVKIHREGDKALVAAPMSVINQILPKECPSLKLALTGTYSTPSV